MFSPFRRRQFRRGANVQVDIPWTCTSARSASSTLRGYLRTDWRRQCKPVRAAACRCGPSASRICRTSNCDTLRDAVISSLTGDMIVGTGDTCPPFSSIKTACPGAGFNSLLALCRIVPLPDHRNFFSVFFGPSLLWKIYCAVRPRLLKIFNRCFSIFLNGFWYFGGVRPSLLTADFGLF